MNGKGSKSFRLTIDRYNSTGRIVGQDALYVNHINGEYHVSIGRSSWAMSERDWREMMAHFDNREAGNRDVPHSN